MQIATHLPTRYETINWEYALLVAIKVSNTGYSRDVSLICEQDEQSGYFPVRCEAAQLEYLRPYAEILRRATYEGGEPPVVPIFRSNGYAHLCVSGAVYDYPELDSVRQRLCTPAKRGGGGDHPHFFQFRST